MQPRTVVVAVDFSETSRRALEEAIGVARQSGAKLHIVHAVEFPTPIFTTYSFQIPDLYLKTARTEAKRLLEEATQQAIAEGIDVKAHLSEAPPVVAIEEVAREVDADLLVLGTHGHTGLKHLALGSVAERTLRHAPCSVLVVKPQPEPGDEAAVRPGVVGA